MQTKKIGQIIAEERQRRSITLLQMSQLTKIKPKYLQYLEANQFAQLPSGTFVKGFIKTYARILNLDQKPLLALLRRDYQENTSGQLLPREFITPMVKKTRFWKPVTLVVVIIATIFFTLLGYVGWQWHNLNKPPTLEVYTPQENEFVSSQIVVTGVTDSEAILAVNAQPVALQPDGSFRTEVYLPKEGIATLTVEAIDQRGKANLKQITVYVKF